MSINRGSAILLATIASFASLPIELAVARPRIRINGPQQTRIRMNQSRPVRNQPHFFPVDIGDLIEKLLPSPDITDRDNNTVKEDLQQTPPEPLCIPSEDEDECAQKKLQIAGEKEANEFRKKHPFNKSFAALRQAVLDAVMKERENQKLGNIVPKATASIIATSIATTAYIEWERRGA